MLARNYRFHGHNSLRFVYTKGRVVRTQYISLKYQKNDRRLESRLAVVVSKKVTKKAPVRNRIRRRLYEVFRQEWAMVQPGYDLVVTVFDERVASEPYQRLQTTVHILLERAELLKR